MSTTHATTDLQMVSQRRTVDGHIVEVRRRDQGRLLRQAMEDRGFSIKALARRTAALDPHRRGVNWRTIGFLVSQYASGRSTTTYANAKLLAQALDVPLSLLFEVRVYNPFSRRPISTQRRSNGDVAR